MVEELYPWNLFNAILEIDADWIKGRFSEDHKAGLTYAVSTLGVTEVLTTVSISWRVSFTQACSRQVS